MKNTSTNAFTLVELILAMTILGLVVSSIYGTMTVGMDAFEKGKYSMELYQGGRIALRKIAEEIHFALAPDAFWRPEDNIHQMSLEQIERYMGGMVIEEEDPGAIRFLGDENSLLFVRKKYQLTKNPPFDLQECRMYVDEKNQALILEVVRSLLAVKQASWFYQHLFQVNLAGQIIPSNGRTRLRQVKSFEDPMLMDFIGNYGMMNHRMVLAEGIKSITFRYSDGTDWNRSWDSQKIIQHMRIPQNSPNYNAVQHTFMAEQGLPSVVEISLELENNDTLTTAIDVPAGDRSRMGMELSMAIQNQPQTRTGLPTQESQFAAPGAQPPTGFRRPGR